MSSRAVLAFLALVSSAAGAAAQTTALGQVRAVPAAAPAGAGAAAAVGPGLGALGFETGIGLSPSLSPALFVGLPAGLGVVPGAVPASLSQSPADLGPVAQAGSSVLGISATGALPGSAVPSALGQLEETVQLQTQEPPAAFSAPSAWDGGARRRSGKDVVEAPSGAMPQALPAPGLSRAPGRGRRLLVPAVAAALSLGWAAPAMALDLAGQVAGLSLGSLGLAFFAGLLAFLSPCTLPLIPAYISFISGMSRQELTSGTDRGAVLRKAGLGSIAFVAGFSLVFIALGATASVLGVFIAAHMAVFSKIAGALVAVFGLHTMGVRIPWLSDRLYREIGFRDRKFDSGLLGAILLGMAFAFGWTPCVGPILSGILALAATGDTVWQGVALLGTFSMGLGIPFILTGFSVNGFLALFNKYKRFITWGNRIAGLVLVLMGLLIATGSMTELLQFVPEWAYRFAV